MCSFLLGGLLFAGVGNFLQVLSIATNYWMQYGHGDAKGNLGLWQLCRNGECLKYDQNEMFNFSATHAFMILAIITCLFGIVICIMSCISFTLFCGFNKPFAAGILYFISCECAHLQCQTPVCLVCFY